jgi:hypothetical protein
MSTKTITHLCLPIEPSSLESDVRKIQDALPFPTVVLAPHSGDSLEDTKERIRQSDLLIISGPQVFIYFGDELVNFTADWILSGGRAMYWIGPNQQEAQTHFLARFNMADTTVRLRPQGGYDVPFIPSEAEFQHEILLRNVDSLVITQPNHIACSGNAQPVLTNQGDFQTIEARTDLFSSQDPAAVCPLCLHENAQGGKLLALSGSVHLADLSDGDIQVSDNLTFMVNTFEYLMS